LFRSVGLRLELRCETLAVLQAITTPAASVQSFLTELTGGQFSSVRDEEGSPTTCCGQLLSEMQPGQSDRDTRNSFTGRNVVSTWTQACELDVSEPELPRAGAGATLRVEQQQPGVMGSRLAALSPSGYAGSDPASPLPLLRRWRALKRGA
jgi:hypothetical protein